MKDLTRTKDHVEMSMCGCLMLDNSLIGEVVDMVEAADFADHGAREIFKAIVGLWSGEKAAEPASVGAALPPSVSVDACYEAVSMVGSAALAKDFAKQIADASLRRKLQSECNIGAAMAKDDDRDVGAVVGDVQARVIKVRSRDAQETLSEVIARVQRESEEASKNKDGMSGIPYMIRGVDNVTGGMRPGELIVVGARSSVGKSALVKSKIVMGNLMGGSASMAVFSPEDSRESFVLRMASQLCGISSRRLRLGDMDREEWTRYGEACSSVEKASGGRLLLDDKARPTPAHIMGACRQWTMAGRKIDFVVIDYLQMMGDIVQGTMYERRTALAYACQAMAKDIRVPVILVAQLSRAAEGREGIRPPVLTDLKETGALEEAANVVLLLHREDRSSTDATLWVAKNKDGPVGDCKLSYHPSTTTFKEA